MSCKGLTGAALKKCQERQITPILDPTAKSMGSDDRTGHVIKGFKMDPKYKAAWEKRTGTRVLPGQFLTQRAIDTFNKTGKITNVQGGPDQKQYLKPEKKDPRMLSATGKVLDSKDYPTEKGQLVDKQYGQYLSQVKDSPKYKAKIAAVDSQRAASKKATEGMSKSEKKEWSHKQYLDMKASQKSENDMASEAKSAAIREKYNSPMSNRTIDKFNAKKNR